MSERNMERKTAVKGPQSCHVFKSVARHIATATCAPETLLEKYTKMALPPGPGGPPLIGQAFSVDATRLHLQFMEWQKEYGDVFMFKMMGKDYLVVNNPDLLRQMFVTCEHAQRLNDRPGGFMGSHVINKSQDILFRNFDEQQKTIKTAVWTYVEKTLLEETWYYDGLAAEMEETVKKISAEKHHSVNLPGILDHTASKLVALLLIGRRVEDQDPAFRSLVGFTESGNQLAVVKTQTILTMFPCARHIPGKIKRTVDSIMEEKGNLKRSFIEDNKSEHGLVMMLQKLKASLQESNDGSHWLTDEFILGTIMDMTAAAIVPLQNTLSSLCLVFALHAEVQEKFRQEVHSVSNNTGTLPTVKDIGKMHYAHACILELKRFHSPLAISARHSNRSGDAVFGEYRIPKNTEIFSNLFGMNHDERFWEDPWSFRPQRFLSEDGTLLPPEHERRRNLLANGVGARACVAIEYTDNNLILAASCLLTKFKIQPADDQPVPDCDPRKFLPGVVIRPADYKCKMVDVDT